MEVNKLTEQVIGAAIEVHRILGPGLLESSYEVCLLRELSLREVKAVREVALPIVYKGLTVPGTFRRRAGTYRRRAKLHAQSLPWRQFEPQRLRRRREAQRI